MTSFEIVAQDLLLYFEAKDASREDALKLSRLVIRSSSSAIRNIHRGDHDSAAKLIDEARSNLSKIHSILKPHQDVRYAGFVDDAEGELAEAMIFAAFASGKELPSQSEINVAYVNYLTGLGDVSGELRRHVLDLIRKGRAEEGERFLEIMEEIYHLLMLFDYPDAISRGLRRKGDLARSMVEKTRGDLTFAIGHSVLEKKIVKLEDKLNDSDRRV